MIWNYTCILRVSSLKLSKWYFCSNLKHLVKLLWQHNALMTIFMVCSWLEGNVMVVIHVEMASSFVSMFSRLVVACSSTVILEIVVTLVAILVVILVVESKYFVDRAEPHTIRCHNMVIQVMLVMFQWLQMLCRLSKVSNLVVSVVCNVIFVAKMAMLGRIVMLGNARMANKTLVVVLVVQTNVCR